MSAGRKLIVFGGNGFVGSQVTRLALSAGWNVVVACRSGAPHPGSLNEPWVRNAQYVAIDALSRSQVFEFLDDHPDTTAIVSSIGLLTTNAREGRRINGDPTINVAAALFERKAIEKLVFVSACDMQPANYVLSGYYQGKRAAERAMLENLGERAVVLRPGMIYGSRALSNGVKLPLGVIGAPLRMVFEPLQRLVPLSILTPPVPVEEVAAAAVYACGEPAVHGVFDVKQIRTLSRSLALQ